MPYTGHQPVDGPELVSTLSRNLKGSMQGKDQQGNHLRLAAMLTAPDLFAGEVVRWAIQ